MTVPRSTNSSSISGAGNRKQNVGTTTTRKRNFLFLSHLRRTDSSSEVISTSGARTRMTTGFSVNNLLLKMVDFCQTTLEKRDRRRLTAFFFLMVVSVIFLGMEHNQIGNPTDYLMDIQNQAMYYTRGAQVTRHPQANLDVTPDDVMLEFVPRLYETPTELFDDLKTHKSCVWVAETESDPLNHNGIWHCQDCGTGETCQTLQPKGVCPSFNMINWDTQDGIHAGSGVRQRSHFRKDARRHSLSWVTQTFDAPTFYESPVCSPDLTLPCFDITRCSREEEGPMKVYVYNPERTQPLLEKIQKAEQLYPLDIQYTTNHDDACLFVVGENSFKQKKDMILNPLYMAGQNHFLLSANILFGSHGDRTKPHSYNMEFAATMSASIYDAQVREGFDMVATMPQPWKRPEKFDHLDLHRPRRLLLSFKGRTEKWKMPFQHHRWLASEYWHNEPDVVVDAACGPRGEGLYELEGEESYGELLLNATFVFAPGGGGVGSFRMTEALAADAIPLVVSHSPLPFAPDVDWSGCVVHISEARIIDAPRILRNIPEEEIRSRRERCRELYKGIYGNELLISLRIWRMRTVQARKKRDALKAVEDVIRDVAAKKGE